MNDSEYVVLLHGILRSKFDMLPLSKFLQDKGYLTLNILYPSRELSLEGLADFVDDKIKSDPRYHNGMTLHFVSHSMGGLITRYYIETYRPINLGKVVMLGPPNTGSEFADWLSEGKIFSPLFKTIYGPAGQQLRTDYQHIDKDITYPLGIIAGNVSLNPMAPWILPGAHDGIVPVDRTRLKGMTDHIVIPATHSFMMFNPAVMKQVHAFLLNAKFEHPEEPSQEKNL